MNTYTDTQLKQALAKMLPERISWEDDLDKLPVDLYWIRSGHTVLDTELLHLAQLARKLKGFTSTLSCNATWQEQVIEML